MNPLRDRLVLALREQGKTLKTIGEAVGLSTEGVRRIIKREELLKKERSEWWYGLSARARNALANMNLESRSAVEQAIKDGTLDPGDHPISSRIRNYGLATHLEVQKWIGLE